MHNNQQVLILWYWLTSRIPSCHSVPPVHQNGFFATMNVSTALLHYLNTLSVAEPQDLDTRAD